MNNIMEIDGLNVWYGHSKILYNVNIALKYHKITTLLGANGAGKTTLLRAISHILVKRTGNIRFDDQDITRLDAEDVVRLGIAHVPDGRGTFRALTVEENLRIGAYARSDRKGIPSDIERIYGYFPRLAERRKQQAGTLSGGEQQMLAISRALMLAPKLILLDEPSLGLAPIIIQEIFAMLVTINKQEGVAMLLVEQNANMALQIADEAYLLETGKVVLGGSAQSLAADETVRRSYLGY